MPVLSLTGGAVRPPVASAETAKCVAVTTSHLVRVRGRARG